MASIDNMLDISVGTDRTTFGINSRLQVFALEKGWQRVDPGFNAVQVAVGDRKNVWAIEATTNSICRLQGKEFVQLGHSKAFRVSVGSGDPTQVWIIGTDDKTYQLRDGKEFVQTPEDSKALEISVFDKSTVWTIGTDQKTWKLEHGNFVQRPTGSKGKQIAVDQSEEVWLVGTDDQYHRLVGSEFVPLPIPWKGSGLSSLSAVNRLLS